MFQDQHPEEGQTPNFKGSMIIVMANTAAEAKEILSKDVYVTEGVWDFDAAQIIPVCNMFPPPFFFALAFLLLLLLLFGYEEGWTN